MIRKPGKRKKSKRTKNYSIYKQKSNKETNENEKKRLKVKNNNP